MRQMGNKFNVCHEKSADLGEQGHTHATYLLCEVGGRQVEVFGVGLILHVLCPLPRSGPDSDGGAEIRPV